MSSKQDRNPSPPPEILTDGEFLPDRIGDTVYSKQWTIKTLMNIVEACDKTKQKVTKLTENAELSNEAFEDATEIIELDPEIEEDACTLWDMSASQKVAQFLFDSGICEIFLDIIEKTKSPRLLEIVVGILGNMCAFESLCQSISRNKALVYTVLLLSGTTDTPSLEQVFRLIISGLKNESLLWFEAFEKNPFFMNNVKDILLNSLNGTLIIATFQLLFTILSENVYYSEVLGQDAFLDSLFIASQQLLKTGECLDSFFCVLNSLCQYVPNVEKIVKKWNELKHLFHDYIDCLGKEECLFDTMRISPVCSYFDTYNTLLSSGLMNQDSILSDANYLSAVARISGAIMNLISNIEKHNQTLLNLQKTETEEKESVLRRVEQRNGSQFITTMTHYEFHTWNVLSETIRETMKTLQNFVVEEREKEILDEILNFDITKENVDVLII